MQDSKEGERLSACSNSPEDGWEKVVVDAIGAAPQTRSERNLACERNYFDKTGTALLSSLNENEESSIISVQAGKDGSHIVEIFENAEALLGHLEDPTQCPPIIRESFSYRRNEDGSLTETRIVDQLRKQATSVFETNVANNGAMSFRCDVDGDHQEICLDKSGHVLSFDLTTKEKYRLQYSTTDGRISAVACYPPDASTEVALSEDEKCELITTADGVIQKLRRQNGLSSVDQPTDQVPASSDEYRLFKSFLEKLKQRQTPGLSALTDPAAPMLNSSEAFPSVEPPNLSLSTTDSPLWTNTTTPSPQEQNTPVDSPPADRDIAYTAAPNTNSILDDELLAINPCSDTSAALPAQPEPENTMTGYSDLADQSDDIFDQSDDASAYLDDAPMVQPDSNMSPAMADLSPPFDVSANYDNEGVLIAHDKVSGSLTKTYPDKTSITVNVSGMVTRVVDARGSAREFLYSNDQKTLIGIIDGDTEWTTSDGKTWRSGDKVLAADKSINAKNGSFTEFDERGRRTTRYLNGSIIERDELNRIVKVVEPQGNSTAFTYDANVPGGISSIRYGSSNIVWRTADGKSWIAYKGDLPVADRKPWNGTISVRDTTITEKSSDGEKIVNSDGSRIKKDAKGQVTETVDARGFRREIEWGVLGEQPCVKSIQEFEPGGKRLSRIEAIGLQLHSSKEEPSPYLDLITKARDGNYQYVQTLDDAGKNPIVGNWTFCKSVAIDPENGTLRKEAVLTGRQVLGKEAQSSFARVDSTLQGTSLAYSKDGLLSASDLKDGSRFIYGLNETRVENSDGTLALLDKDGRLKRYEAGKTTVAFKYDSEGHLIEISESNGTTWYSTDGKSFTLKDSRPPKVVFGVPFAETNGHYGFRDADGRELFRRIPAEGVVVEKLQDGGSVHYLDKGGMIVRDANNRIVARTDANGNGVSVTRDPKDPSRYNEVTMKQADQTPIKWTRESDGWTMSVFEPTADGKGKWTRSHNGKVAIEFELCADGRFVQDRRSSDHVSRHLSNMDGSSIDLDAVGKPERSAVVTSADGQQSVYYFRDGELREIRHKSSVHGKPDTVLKYGGIDSASGKEFWLELPGDRTKDNPGLSKHYAIGRTQQGDSDPKALTSEDKAQSRLASLDEQTGELVLWDDQNRGKLTRSANRIETDSKGTERIPFERGGLFAKAPDGTIKIDYPNGTGRNLICAADGRVIQMEVSGKDEKGQSFKATWKGSGDGNLWAVETRFNDGRVTTETKQLEVRISPEGLYCETNGKIQRIERGDGSILVLDQERRTVERTDASGAKIELQLNDKGQPTRIVYADGIIRATTDGITWCDCTTDGKPIPGTSKKENVRFDTSTGNLLRVFPDSHTAEQLKADGSRHLLEQTKSGQYRLLQETRSDGVETRITYKDDKVAFTEISGPHGAYIKIDPTGKVCELRCCNTPEGKQAQKQEFHWELKDTDTGRQELQVTSFTDERGEKWKLENGKDGRNYYVNLSDPAAAVFRGKLNVMQNGTVIKQDFALPPASSDPKDAIWFADTIGLDGRGVRQYDHGKGVALLDESGRIEKIVDRDGKAISLKWSARDRIASITVEVAGKKGTMTRADDNTWKFSSGPVEMQFNMRLSLDEKLATFTSINLTDGSQTDTPPGDKPVVSMKLANLHDRLKTEGLDWSSGGHESIHNLIKDLTPDEIAAVKWRWKNKYGTDLLDAIKKSWGANSDTTKWLCDYLDRRATTPDQIAVEKICINLRDCVTSLAGQWTAEGDMFWRTQLRTNLAGMNSRQIAMAKRIWKERYGTELEDGIKDKQWDKAPKIHKDAIQLYLKGSDKRTSDEEKTLILEALKVPYVNKYRAEIFKEFCGKRASNEARAKVKEALGANGLADAFPVANAIGVPGFSETMFPLLALNNVLNSLTNTIDARMEAVDYVAFGNTSAAKKLMMAHGIGLGSVDEENVRRAFEDMTPDERQLLRQGHQIQLEISTGKKLAFKLTDKEKEAFGYYEFMVYASRNLHSWGGTINISSSPGVKLIQLEGTALKPAAYEQAYLDMAEENGDVNKKLAEDTNSFWFLPNSRRDDIFKHLEEMDEKSFKALCTDPGREGVFKGSLQSRFGKDATEHFEAKMDFARQLAGEKPAYGRGKRDNGKDTSDQPFSDSQLGRYLPGTRTLHPADFKLLIESDKRDLKLRQALQLETEIAARRAKKEDVTLTDKEKELLEYLASDRKSAELYRTLQRGEALSRTLAEGKLLTEADPQALSLSQRTRLQLYNLYSQGHLSEGDAQALAAYQSWLRTRGEKIAIPISEGEKVSKTLLSAKTAGERYKLEMNLNDEEFAALKAFRQNREGEQLFAQIATGRKLAVEGDSKSGAERNTWQEKLSVEDRLALEKYLQFRHGKLKEPDRTNMDQYSASQFLKESPEGARLALTEYQAAMDQKALLLYREDASGLRVFLAGRREEKALSAKESPAEQMEAEEQLKKASPQRYATLEEYRRQLHQATRDEVRRPLEQVIADKQNWITLSDRKAMYDGIINMTPEERLAYAKDENGYRKKIDEIVRSAIGKDDACYMAARALLDQVRDNPYKKPEKNIAVNLLIASGVDWELEIKRVKMLTDAFNGPDAAELRGKLNPEDKEHFDPVFAEQFKGAVKKVFGDSNKYVNAILKNGHPDMLDLIGEHLYDYKHLTDKRNRIASDILDFGPVALAHINSSPDKYVLLSMFRDLPEYQNLLRTVIETGEVKTEDKLRALALGIKSKDEISTVLSEVKDSRQRIEAVLAYEAKFKSSTRADLLKVADVGTKHGIMLWTRTREWTDQERVDNAYEDYLRTDTTGFYSGTNYHWDSARESARERMSAYLAAVQAARVRRDTLSPEEYKRHEQELVDCLRAYREGKQHAADALSDILITGVAIGGSAVTGGTSLALLAVVMSASAAIKLGTKMALMGEDYPGNWQADLLSGAISGAINLIGPGEIGKMCGLGRQAANKCIDQLIAKGLLKGLSEKAQAALRAELEVVVRQQILNGTFKLGKEEMEKVVATALKNGGVTGVTEKYVSDLAGKLLPEFETQLSKGMTIVLKETQLLVCGQTAGALGSSAGYMADVITTNREFSWNDLGDSAMHGVLGATLFHGPARAYVRWQPKTTGGAFAKGVAEFSTQFVVGTASPALTGQLVDAFRGREHQGGDELIAGLTALLQHGVGETGHRLSHNFHPSAKIVENATIAGHHTPKEPGDVVHYKAKLEHADFSQHDAVLHDAAGTIDSGGKIDVFGGETQLKVNVPEKQTLVVVVHESEGGGMPRIELDKNSKGVVIIINATGKELPPHLAGLGTLHPENLALFHVSDGEIKIGDYAQKKAVSTEAPPSVPREVEPQLQSLKDLTGKDFSAILNRESSVVKQIEAIRKEATPKTHEAIEKIVSELSAARIREIHNSGGGKAERLKLELELQKSLALDGNEDERLIFEKIVRKQLANKTESKLTPKEVIDSALSYKSGLSSGTIDHAQLIRALQLPEHARRAIVDPTVGGKLVYRAELNGGSIDFAEHYVKIGLSVKDFQALADLGPYLRQMVDSEAHQGTAREVTAAIEKAKLFAPDLKALEPMVRALHECTQVWRDNGPATPEARERALQSLLNNVARTMERHGSTDFPAPTIRIESGLANRAEYHIETGEIWLRKEDVRDGLTARDLMELLSHELVHHKQTAFAVKAIAQHYLGDVPPPGTAERENYIRSARGLYTGFSGRELEPATLERILSSKSAPVTREQLSKAMELAESNRKFAEMGAEIRRNSNSIDALDKALKNAQPEKLSELAATLKDHPELTQYILGSGKPDPAIVQLLEKLADTKAEPLSKTQIDELARHFNSRLNMEMAVRKNLNAAYFALPHEAEAHETGHRIRRALGLPEDRQINVPLEPEVVPGRAGPNDRTAQAAIESLMQDNARKLESLPEEKRRQILKATLDGDHARAGMLLEAEFKKQASLGKKSQTAEEFLADKVARNQIDPSQLEKIKLLRPDDRTNVVSLLKQMPDLKTEGMNRLLGLSAEQRTECCNLEISGKKLQEVLNKGMLDGNTLRLLGSANDRIRIIAMDLFSRAVDYGHSPEHIKETMHLVEGLAQLPKEAVDLLRPLLLDDKLPRALVKDLMKSTGTSPDGTHLESLRRLMAIFLENKTQPELLSELMGINDTALRQAVERSLVSKKLANVDDVRTVLAIAANSPEMNELCRNVLESGTGSVSHRDALAALVETSMSRGELANLAIAVTKVALTSTDLAQLAALAPTERALSLKLICDGMLDGRSVQKLLERSPADRSASLKLIKDGTITEKQSALLLVEESGAASLLEALNRNVIDKDKLQQLLSLEPSHRADLRKALGEQLLHADLRLTPGDFERALQDSTFAKKLCRMAQDSTFRDGVRIAEEASKLPGAHFTEETRALLESVVEGLEHGTASGAAKLAALSELIESLKKSKLPAEQKESQLRDLLPLLEMERPNLTVLALKTEAFLFNENYAENSQTIKEAQQKNRTVKVAGTEGQVKLLGMDGWQPKMSGDKPARDSQGRFIMENSGRIAVPAAEKARYLDKAFKVVAERNGKVILELRTPLRISVDESDLLASTISGANKTQDRANCVNSTRALLANIGHPEGFSELLAQRKLIYPEPQPDQKITSFSWDKLPVTQGKTVNTVFPEDLLKLEPGIYRAQTGGADFGKHSEAHTFVIVVPEKGAPFILDPSAGARYPVDAYGTRLSLDPVQSAANQKALPPEAITQRLVPREPVSARQAVTDPAAKFRPQLSAEFHRTHRPETIARISRALDEATRSGWQDITQQARRAEPYFEAEATLQRLVKEEAQRLERQGMNPDQARRLAMDSASTGAADSPLRVQFDRCAVLRARHEHDISPVEGRNRSLQALLDRVCDLDHVPRLRLQVVNGLADRGTYEIGTGTIRIRQSDVLNPSGGERITDTIHHEFTHHQQDVLIVRAIAREQGTGIPPTPRELAQLRASYRAKTGSELNEHFARSITETPSPILTPEQMLRATQLARSFNKLHDNQIEYNTALQSERSIANEQRLLREDPSRAEITLKTLATASLTAKEALVGKSSPAALNDLVELAGQGKLTPRDIENARRLLDAVFSVRLNYLEKKIEQCNQDYLRQPHEAEAQEVSRMIQDWQAQFRTPAKTAEPMPLVDPEDTSVTREHQKRVLEKLRTVNGAPESAQRQVPGDTTTVGENQKYQAKSGHSDSVKLEKGTVSFNDASGKVAGEGTIEVSGKSTVEISVPADKTVRLIVKDGQPNIKIAADSRGKVVVVSESSSDMFFERVRELPAGLKEHDGTVRKNVELAPKKMSDVFNADQAVRVKREFEKVSPPPKGPQLPAEELARRAEKIYDRAREDVPGGVPKQEKVLHIVVGPPGAGKSSSLVDPLAREYGAVVVDSDHIKPTLPGYDKGLGTNKVHPDSAEINKRVLAKAMENGDNLVYPQLGRDEASMRKLIEEARAKGYKVAIHLAEVPPEVSAQRCFERAMDENPKSGVRQMVNPSFALEVVGYNPQAVFEKMISEPNLVDQWSHHNMNRPMGEKTLVRESATKIPTAQVK